MSRLRWLLLAGGLLCGPAVLGQDITVSGASGAGNVVGPGAACTDNTLPRFDGATATQLQCSDIVVTDGEAITGVVSLTATTLNSTALTASQLVVTDGSKNLASNGAITTNAVVKSASSGATLAASTIIDNGTTVTTTLPVVVPAGSSSTAAFTFTGAGANTGFGSNGSNDVRLWTNGGTEVTVASGVFSYLFRSGNTLMRMQSGDFTIASGQVINWSNATNSVTTADVGLARTAAGVIKTTNGSSGAGWIQNTAGDVTLASDYTNATTTFSNTALSVTVASGRKYTFTLRAFMTDSVAADGAKFDFEGGTAAATNFRAHCVLYDTALLLSTQVTALATDITQATMTGASMLECAGSFEPSGAGTFIFRAAQNAHTTGTLTIHRGSYMWVNDTP